MVLAREERAKSGKFMELTFHEREDGTKYCVTEKGDELQCNASGVPLNAKGECFVKTEDGQWMPPGAASKSIHDTCYMLYVRCLARFPNVIHFTT